MQSITTMYILVYNSTHLANNKHGIWWPLGTPPDATRLVFLFRWPNPNRLHRFANTYPYYIILSEEERAACKRQAEKAAQRRCRFSEPTPPLRIPPPRSAKAPTYESLLRSVPYNLRGVCTSRMQTG